MIRRATVAAIAFLLFLAPRAGRAQDIVATSFEQLHLAVRLGETVKLTDTAGADTRGRVASLHGSTLTLQVDGTRRDFDEGDVRRITQSRHASLAVGARRGFITGAVLGIIGSLAVVSECHECGAAVPFVALAYGGFGAGVGVGISSLITREHVVFKP